MDDFDFSLDFESAIIGGLQILIFIFLVLAIIAFVWIGISNSRIRAVFRANLPNHLDLLRNRSQSQIERQLETSTDNDNKANVTSPSQRREFPEHRQRRKNFLPPSLTPYATKNTQSQSEDIIKTSHEIQKSIHQDKDENSDEGEVHEKPSNAPRTVPDLFKKIQQEGEKLAEEAKKQEKERKAKEKEERERKQKEMEEKEKVEEEKEENKGTSSLFNFSFKKT